MPQGWSALKSTLRLDQKWSMFAPYPKKSDGWLVIPGLTEDGRLVNVFQPGRELSFLKPDRMFADYYENYRWRKYLTRIPTKRYEAYRATMEVGSVDNGTKESPRGSASPLLIFIVCWSTGLPGETMRVTRHKVWRHYCFKNEGTSLSQHSKKEGFGRCPAVHSGAQPVSINRLV